jgi:hypothetical protein
MWVEGRKESSQFRDFYVDGVNMQVNEIGSGKMD